MYLHLQEMDRDWCFPLSAIPSSSLYVIWLEENRKCHGIKEKIQEIMAPYTLNFSKPEPPSPLAPPSIDSSPDHEDSAAVQKGKGGIMEEEEEEEKKKVVVDGEVASMLRQAVELSHLLTQQNFQVRGSMAGRRLTWLALLMSDCMCLCWSLCL